MSQLCLMFAALKLWEYFLLDMCKLIKASFTLARIFAASMLDLVYCYEAVIRSVVICVPCLAHKYYRTTVEAPGFNPATGLSNYPSQQDIQ